MSDKYFLKWEFYLRVDWVVRNKQYNYGTVLIVIETYKYMVYVQIFVTINCSVIRADCIIRSLINKKWFTKSGLTNLVCLKPHICCLNTRLKYQKDWNGNREKLNLECVSQVKVCQTNWTELLWYKIL